VIFQWRLIVSKPITGEAQKKMAAIWRRTVPGWALIFQGGPVSET
jgi:hypothetical protein